MNTYLIFSETNYFINEKIKELTNGITNIIYFNMDENTMMEILEEASYFSMFNDKKCVIVKNTNIFMNKETNKNKEDINKLKKYLENENSNTILIFITNSKVDTKKDIYKLLSEHNNVFIYNNITKTEIKNELKQMILSNGYKIDDNSLWYIINNSLGNFDLAINEINKLMIYYSKPCQIKYDDVINLVSKTINDNNFKLIDAIINKDLESSIKYIKELEILKIEPSVIISLLYREFKLMLSLLIYENNNYDEKEILKELNIASWQYDKIKGNLRRYNKNEIKNTIVNLSKKDYELKSGLLSKEVVLIDFIFELCFE